MRYLIVLLFLSVSQNALARIGENLKQCDERYGKAIRFVKNSIFYYKSPFAIQVVPHNGKVISVVYWKIERDKFGAGFMMNLQEISRDEIDLLLRANSQSEWKINVLGIWETADGKLSGYSEKPGGLMILDNAGNKDKNRKAEIERRKQLSGF